MIVAGPLVLFADALLNSCPGSAAAIDCTRYSGTKSSSTFTGQLPAPRMPMVFQPSMICYSESRKMHCALSTALSLSFTTQASMFHCAPTTPDEVLPLIGYLAKHYPEQPMPLARVIPGPVQINSDGNPVMANSTVNFVGTIEIK